MRRADRALRFAVLGVTVAAVVVAAAIGIAGAPAAQAAATTGAPYPCTATGGPNGDAAAIGWTGNAQGATACLGGSFYVYNGINQSYGFGVYNDSPTTWTNADGYLPALITGFKVSGASVSITNFADDVTINGDAYVLAYSRVSVHNPTSGALTVDPQPTAGLVSLGTAPDVVRPGGTVNHDYVVAIDKFGGSYAWPTAAQLRAAGAYNGHFAHMAAYWNSQLKGIAMPQLPSAALVNAYKAGFAYAQIDRDGLDLDTGTNGYHAEYEHDVIGILAGFFNQGYFGEAHPLLDEVDKVVGTNTGYSDGTWAYPWLWAIYYQKTGDLSFLKQHFSQAGEGGPAVRPSIEAAAQTIAADRTGPGGIIGTTNDIDADGNWTSDDYEALLGLASYEYLAGVVGDSAQVSWAKDQYASLSTALNAALSNTITSNGLDYLPCSVVEPNTSNRCGDALDANWAAPATYYNWAWNGYLMDAPITSPTSASMASWIDSTLTYGFGRTENALPANTFGGYPGEGEYSTAYNAAYGSWGLASNDYRDEGILAYEFMLSNDQSGPNAWWEGSTAPSSTTPWVGLHPASGGGSSPHSWGIALANMTLLDSLVAQRADGALLVGRGVPNSWVASDQPFGATNVPVSGGKRIGVSVQERGDVVTLRLSGARRTGATVFELPAFVNDIASASAGTIDQAAGSVTVGPTVNTLTVVLRHEPSTATTRPPSNAPKITAVQPASAAAGQTVTVTGTNFGATQGSSYLLFSDNGVNWGQPGDAAAFQVDSWSDTAITFTVPTPSGPGGEYAVTPGTTASVLVNTVNGVSNTSAVQIAAPPGTPAITGVTPNTASAGTVVTVTGSNFGATQGSSYLKFTDGDVNWGQPGDLATFQIDSWSDTAITFTIPSPSGPGGEYAVTAGTTASVVVATSVGTSNPERIQITS